MKKYFIFGALGMIVVLGFVFFFANYGSADDLTTKTSLDISKGDNLTLGTKQIKYNDIWETYKPIEVKSDGGSTLFKGAIVEHTGECLSNCHSTVDVFLGAKGVLIDEFYLENEAGERVDRPFSLSYTIKENKTIPEYEYKCVDTKEQYKNGTYVQKCSNDFLKNNIVEEEITYPLKVGQVVNGGNYKVNIHVTKKPEDNLDWRIVVAGNKLIGEWAWFNSSWNYRKSLTFSVTGNPTIADMQVPITIPWNQSYKTDYSDIRFTASDGTTELPYWVESKSDSTTAKVWVRLNTNVTSSATVLAYMYFNNSGASTASNENTTFNFYDDFNSANTTKWGAISGSLSVSGGEATIDADFLYSDIGMKLGQVYEGRLRYSVGADASSFRLENTTAGRDNPNRISTIQVGNQVQSYSAKDGVGGADTVIASSFAGTSYYILTVARANSSNTDYYMDGVFKATRTSGIPIVELRMMLDEYSSGSMIVDWVRVRGYNNTVITTTFGNQEDNSVPCVFAGYIKYSNGTGVIGSNVSVTNLYLNSEYYSTTTDANGYWTVNITNSTKLFRVQAQYNSSLSGLSKGFISGTC